MNHLQTQRSRWVPALATLACLMQAPGCSDAFDTEGEFVLGWCEDQRIDRLRPMDTSTDAYVDGWVFAELDCGSAEADISLQSTGGVMVLGVTTSHRAGQQVRFRPNLPLETRTGYHARLLTPEGYRDWTFTTSVLGDAAGSTLEGHAIALRIAESEVLSPPGLDELLYGLLGAVHPVVQFTGDAGGGTVALRLGARIPGNPAQQHSDVATADGTAAWDDPFFDVGSLSIDWVGAGVGFRVEDARVAGAVAPTGASGGGGGSFEGLWDLRPALGGQAAVDSACLDTEEAGGAPCEPCSDGATACVPLLLVHSPGEAWTGLLEAVP